MDRISRLRGTSTRSSRILEIGPSHAPVAPKADGWNTFVLDHASREDLRKKYEGIDGVDIDAIEEVDAVWREGNLHDVVPTRLHGCFDTLIASHVIEHLPDFAGFLVSAQKLLGPTGVVALAVPDRRYCFDYFKPPSMTGDVLDAHVAMRSRHPIRTVWNQTAYSVAWDGATAWGQQPVHEAQFTSSFAAAKASCSSYSDAPSTPYLDCHAWHFTPAGFALVILELGQLGIIDWHLETVHGPEGCEFLAFLRRGADHVSDMSMLQEQRMALLRDQLHEMREQIDFALATEPGNIGSPAATVSADNQTPPLTQIVELLRSQQACLREIQTTTAGVSDVHRLAEALAEAEHAVTAQQEEVTALRALLDGRTAELAQANSDLITRNADLRFARARVATLSALSEQCQKERALILASRSWRVAAPLRLAGRTLRTITGRLRPPVTAHGRWQAGES